MYSAVCSVAWCSIVEVMMCLHPKSLTEAMMTVLLLSVPPLVKNISAGCAFKIFATVFLAVSIAILASRPNEYVEEGLPKLVVSQGTIASNTSGLICVVAALSK